MPAGVADDRKRPELIDGVHRLDGWEALGGRIEITNLYLPKLRLSKSGVPPERHFIDPTEGDPVSLVISLNLRRRHLASHEQIKALTTELRKEHPEWSDRRIGKELGKDHKTVATIRQEGWPRGEIPHVAVRLDSLGRSQPATKAQGVSLSTRASRKPPEELPPINPFAPLAAAMGFKPGDDSVQPDDPAGPRNLAADDSRRVGSDDWSALKDRLFGWTELSVSPERAAEVIPDYRRANVIAELYAAMAWLQRFAEIWGDAEVT